MKNADRITFQTQELDLVIKAKGKLRSWIIDAIHNEGKKSGDIAYILCTDEYLLEMNQTYLQHDDYTDVITFDYTEDGRVSGDIFISYERVVDNAALLNRPVEEELHRVMIHGVMHLCGYKDKKPAERARMTQKEDQYLATFAS